MHYDTLDIIFLVRFEKSPPLSEITAQPWLRTIFLKVLSTDWNDLCWLDGKVSSVGYVTMGWWRRIAS